MKQIETPNGNGKQTASVVNTFLLFCTLGLLAFIGKSTVDNSNKLERIEASQISRMEMDARLAEMRGEIVRLASRQVDVEIQLSRINARLP